MGPRGWCLGFCNISVLSDQKTWLELKSSTPWGDSSNLIHCWSLSVFPSFLPLSFLPAPAKVWGWGCSKEESTSRRWAWPMHRRESQVGHAGGRAVCISTPHVSSQPGQRSSQEFLLSQRDVQAAASFMNLAFHLLGFYFRTPRGKLSRTFYPKSFVLVFF